MGLSHSPSIVTNGLVLALDAANPKSYSSGAGVFQNFITPARMNGSSTFASMLGVTVNSSGLFVAVGFNNNNYPLYATSVDGSTWTTPATMNGSTTYAQMQSVTVNSSGLFVAVGYDSSGAAVYATSSNGSTWTTPARMNGSATLANMYSITVNSSGRFVAVGYDAVSNIPRYATSTDGTTWTSPARIGSGTNAWMFSVTVNSSGLFVAVGYDSNVSTPLYATSTDGTTWTTPAAINATASYPASITVNSAGLFVLVGVTSSNHPMYATSTNGSTWSTPATMNGSSSSFIMTSVTVNSSGRFIAVGYDSTNAPLFATSSDGTTWTTPARMNGSSVYAQPQGVAVNSSGVFVAVGSDSSSAPIFANSITTNLAPTAWTDLSGLGNTGTLSTGAITTYNSSNGGSIVFDGTSQYVTSSFATSSGQAVTYCGWLYSTETTATYRNFVDSITARPMIWWNASGQIEFDAADYTTTTVYRNQWVHVALSKPVNSSSASYYVNGVLVGTGTQYSTPAVTPTWFNRAAAQTWKGNSSLIQVYNSALSASEIKQNFNAQRSRYAL